MTIPAATEKLSLLLVEDESIIANPVSRGLREEGYRVDVAPDGETGLRLGLLEDYDVFLVDWRLPGLDGRTVVERLRLAGVDAPILMLTALRDLDYVVAGLDAGADDYLTKPFSFVELLARLRAVVRRRETQSSAVGHLQRRLKCGPLTMDTLKRTVHMGPDLVELRAKEFAMLEFLMRLDGAVATRTRIAEYVWGSAFDVTGNALDITVSNLRHRLRGGQYRTKEVQIETVRGVGYRLTCSDG